MSNNSTSIQTFIQETTNGGRDFGINSKAVFNSSELNEFETNENSNFYSFLPEEEKTNTNSFFLDKSNVVWFPDDLGSESNSHYVKFEIFLVDTNLTPDEKSLGGFVGEKLKFEKGIDPRFAINSSSKTRNVDNLVSSSYKKLDQIIALPMPETIVSDHSTLWSRHEGGLISATISKGDEFTNGGNTLDSISSILKSITLSTASGITNLLEQVGLEGTKTNLKLLTKRATNPRNEFLFDGVNNRSFNFQWKLIPRSASEAYKMMHIIERMKLYMYPELDQSTSGSFFIFPAVFDITFMNGEEENKWLYRTSTCALTNMLINYTGMGQWVSNELDSLPAACELTLQFTEMEFLYRQRFKTFTNPDGVAR